MQKNQVRKPVHGPTHAMTIDVEEFFQVSAFKDVVSQEQWSSQPSRVVQSTEKLLSLFESQQIKATFFILGWVADKHPGLVRQINEAGHEIASHGYSHQLIYGQDQTTFRDETLRSKDILESIINKPVIGYRAASYSITKKSLWALDILADLGFKWDSSIFPVYHDNYGIPDTPSDPYTIRTLSGKSLVEFPITSAKKFGLSIPAAGGGYFRQFPYALFKHLFNSASNNNSNPRIFYLHPWEVDPDQPRFNSASWFSRYRHYTNLHRCEDRLKKLISDFNFSTLSSSLSDYDTSEVYSCTKNELIKLS